MLMRLVLVVIVFGVVAFAVGTMTAPEVGEGNPRIKILAAASIAKETSRRVGAGLLLGGPYARHHADRTRSQVVRFLCGQSEPRKLRSKARLKHSSRFISRLLAVISRMRPPCVMPATASQRVCSGNAQLLRPGCWLPTAGRPGDCASPRPAALTYHVLRRTGAILF